MVCPSQLADDVPSLEPLEELDMTLIVALFNEQEIVIAADTMIYDTSRHKLLEPFHKIMPVGRHVFAASGTTTLFDIMTLLNAEGKHPNFDIDIAAGEYYKWTNEVFQARRYSEKQGGDALLAGFGKDGARVYSWHLPSQNGLVSNPGRIFLGARENTATFFPIFLHRDSALLGERIQLAHFCIALAGRSDPRVGDPHNGYPIDISVLTKEGLKAYTQEELKPYIDRGEKLYIEIQALFARGI